MGVVERLLNDFLEDTEFPYTVGNSEGRGFGGGRGDIGNIDIDNGELPDIGDFSKPDDGQLPFDNKGGGFKRDDLGGELPDKTTSMKGIISTAPNRLAECRFGEHMKRPKII